MLPGVRGSLVRFHRLDDANQIVLGLKTDHAPDLVEFRHAARHVVERAAVRLLVGHVHDPAIGPRDLDHPAAKSFIEISASLPTLNTSPRAAGVSISVTSAPATSATWQKQRVCVPSP